MSTTSFQNPAPPDPGSLHTERRNQLALDVYCDRTGLPRLTTVVRDNGAYLTVTSADHLLTWLRTTGGSIHRGAAIGGIDLWGLHTNITRGDGTRMPVVVGVPVPVCEVVPAELAAAVGRATLASTPEAGTCDVCGDPPAAWCSGCAACRCVPTCDPGCPVQMRPAPQQPVTLADVRPEWDFGTAEAAR